MEDDAKSPGDGIREPQNERAVTDSATVAATPSSEGHEDQNDAAIDLSSVIQSAMEANFGMAIERESAKEEEEGEDPDLAFSDAINNAFKNNMDALLETEQGDEAADDKEGQTAVDDNTDREEAVHHEPPAQEMDLESVINDALKQNMDAIKADENIDPILNSEGVQDQNTEQAEHEGATSNSNEDDLAHANLDFNAAIANALTAVDHEEVEREPESEEEVEYPKVTATQKAHEEDVKHFDNLYNDIQNIMGDMNQKDPTLEEAMRNVDINEVMQKSLGEQGSFEESNELQRAIADALKDHNRQQRPKAKNQKVKTKQSTADLSSAIHDALKESNIVDSNETDFQKALEDIVHDVVENTLNKGQSQSDIQNQLQFQHEQLSKHPKNDDLNWDTILGNALKLAMNDEMLLDDDKKLKKVRSKKSNRNLVFVPDGTNRKMRNQMQIKKFSNKLHSSPKPTVSTELLVNLLSSVDLKNIKTSAMVQSLPTSLLELIKKSVSTSISSLINAPSAPIPSTADVSVEEKTKIENRERKKRWREFNTERNRDLDLKTRVTKKAMSLFPGEEHQLLRNEWISAEFAKRRAKRLLKEQRTREALPFSADSLNLVPYELIFHDIDIISKFVSIYNEMGGNITTDKILSSTMDKSVILTSITTVLAVIFLTTTNQIDDKNVAALVTTVVNTLNTFLDNNPTLMTTNNSLLPFNPDDQDLHDDVNPDTVSINEKEAAIDELKKSMALQDELERANQKSYNETGDANNLFAQDMNLQASTGDALTANVENLESSVIANSMRRLSLSVQSNKAKDAKMRNQMQVFKPVGIMNKKRPKKPEPLIDITKFMRPPQNLTTETPAAVTPFTSGSDTTDQVIPEKRKGDAKIEEPLRKALSPSPAVAEENTFIEKAVAPTPKLPQYLKSKVKAPITTQKMRPLSAATIKTQIPNASQSPQAYRKPGAFKKPITFGRPQPFRANVAPPSIVKREPNM